MSWQASREHGLEWEEDWAKRIGGKLVSGSGNTFYCKLDVGGRQILWSLKATRGDSYPLSRGELEEATAGARGLGGPGVIPGMAVRIAHFDTVTLVAEDLISILTAPAEYGIPESKTGARRRRASIPSLLRGDDDAVA